MFVLRNLIVATGDLLNGLLRIYQWIIIISALLSWVNPDPYNPIVRFLRNVTEPALYRLRRVLPILASSGIDLSPIVLLFAVEFVRVLMVRSLYELAGRLAAAAPGFFVA